MTSLLANLLGLTAGLGACAAAFGAWRKRSKGRHSEQEAAAHRRKRELERVNAEAAQRSDALARREAAMSELARRREALRQGRGPLLPQTSRPARTTPAGPTGERPRPADAIPPDVRAPSAPSGQPLQWLAELPTVKVPTPVQHVPAPELPEERPTIARGGAQDAYEGGALTLAAEASPAEHLAVQHAPEAVQAISDLRRPIPDEAAPSETVLDANSRAAASVDVPATPTSASQQLKGLLQDAAFEAVAASPALSERAAETSDAGEAAGLETDRALETADACASSTCGAEAVAVPDQVDAPAGAYDDTIDDVRPQPSGQPIVPSDDAGAAHNESDSGPAKPAVDALWTAPETVAVDASTEVPVEGSDVTPDDAAVESTHVAVNPRPADAPTTSAPEQGFHVKHRADLDAPAEQFSGVVEDAKAANGLAAAEVPAVEAESPPERDVVPDEPAEVAAAATAPVDDLPAPGPSVAEPEGSPRERAPRTPVHRYRPAVQDPSRVKAAKPRAPSVTPRDRALAIDLRLNLQRGGGCILSLVGRRNDEIPDQVRVSANHGAIDLTAMQDGWFEDVRPDDLGATLQTGVQWSYHSGDGSTRWLLSGRSVFVLARHEELSGVVNTPRLELGQSHVVICTQARAADVRAALTACGAEPASESGQAHGLPARWLAFHGVTPKRPVPASSEGSDLDCLCPRPDARLQLEGGIRLEGSAWLVGFPPRIFVLGDPEAVGDVYIDQKAARRSGDGTLTAPGWDAAGAHLVASAVGTKSYSVQDPPRTWTPWAQTSAQAPLLHDGQGGRSVCGALVTQYQTGGADMRAVLVPSTNTLLIGAEPGQIWVCDGAPHLPVTAARVGFPPFKPVWAAPQRPLRCDKRSAAVLLLPEGAHAAPGASHARGRRTALKPEERAWCAVILDASRKGLAVSPSDPHAAELWRAYRAFARSMTRSGR